MEAEVEVEAVIAAVVQHHPHQQQAQVPAARAAAQRARQRAAVLMSPSLLRALTLSIYLERLIRARSSFICRLGLEVMFKLPLSTQ